MTMEKKSKGGRKAPEGGWGWMIVAGCFLAVVCIRAVTRCISMFFVEFQLQFGKDYSTTSWIHSLIDCTTMLCAPLGGFLESRISCRATVILGGLISSAGLVFSSIASSLEHLYVSLGFLTGLGFALCYTPVLAMVGRYFDERKSLAYGIALSGAGIGTFILPPAVQVLIERYSWRGALLILAGFVSNLCVCGALMRPLEPSRDERTCEKNEANMEKGSMAPLTDYKDTEKASDDCSKVEQKQPETNHLKEQQRLITDEKQKSIGPDNNKLVQGNTAFLTNLSLPSSNLKVRNIAECILLSNKLIADSANEDLKLMETMNFNRKAADIAEKREDSGLSKAQSTDACYLDKTISNTNTEAPSRGGFCLTLRENIGFFMFPDFLFLSLSFVFLAYGCSAPVVYLVPYALSVGVVHRQAALLMSIFGISCIVGNFTFGWITDKKCLKRYRMLSYMLAIGMEGIFCLFVPFLHSFSPLVVFSVLYGYFDGAYVALIPVVTCDVVGSSHLTSALGVVYFLHAIPYLISPPIGGWLVDQTGNYEATYFLNGTSFMFSSMALIAMLVRRHCRSKSASATEHVSPFKFTDTLYQLFTFWKRDDTSGR